MSKKRIENVFVLDLLGHREVCGMGALGSGMFLANLNWLTFIKSDVKRLKFTQKIQNSEEWKEIKKLGKKKQDQFCKEDLHCHQRQFLKKKLSSLDHDAREILNLHFGAVDGELYTQEEIARIFKITEEEAKEIKKETFSVLDPEIQYSLMFQRALCNPCPDLCRGFLTRQHEFQEPDNLKGDDLIYQRPVRRINQFKESYIPSESKILGFLQSFMMAVELDEQAAILVPDQVLSEGGPFETVRREFFDEYNLHTILRLPVIDCPFCPDDKLRMNVIFFNWMGKPSDTWIYDCRTGIKSDVKEDSQQKKDAKELEKFQRCYHSHDLSKRKETWGPKTPNGRWRRFTKKDLLRRPGVNLDIIWLPE
ncbi:MAG: N-6 DNA methylase [Planctomycetia bacterium]|nr:N-6 DNA methylase [Planctomycetia bacterium]